MAEDCAYQTWSRGDSGSVSEGSVVEIEGPVTDADSSDPEGLDGAGADASAGSRVLLAARENSGSREMPKDDEWLGAPPLEAWDCISRAAPRITATLMAPRIRPRPRLLFTLMHLSRSFGSNAVHACATPLPVCRFVTFLRFPLIFS